MGKVSLVRCWAVPMAMLLLVVGCQGETPGNLNSPESMTTATMYGPEPSTDNDSWRSGVSAEELEADWLQWLDGPWGVPGVDYNDREIAVGYKRGAKVPAKYVSAAQLLAEDKRAANRPNAILRHDKAYELLTDAIAAAFNLEIRHQVYNDYSVWASFTVEEGRDSTAILEQVRANFAAEIEFATFPGAGEGAWLPDDPDFLDYTGTQQAPEQMWGQHLIGCEQAWDYTRGTESILIAIIDDAFRLSHEELQATVLDPQIAFPDHELDVGSGDNVVTPDNDDQFHGTRVVSLLAAEGNNGRSIIGVAPDCRVMPIKVADSLNHQFNTDFTVGVNLAVDLGARVISASWGTRTAYPPMAEAAERAYNNDVLFVAAAHNHNSFINVYPVAYEYVLGVGATGFLPDGSTMDDWEPDTRSDFSNYGDYVDMAAPGRWMKTCAAQADDAYYNAFSGTSASCPLVAGIAAIIYSIDPSLSVDRVATSLAISGEPTKDFPIGTVLRLNAPAAIVEALRDLMVGGTVKDASTGEVIPGVTVSLPGLDAQVTAGDGTFLITGVSDGTYTLTVEHPAYLFEQHGEELVVGSGDITDLEIVGWRADLPVLDSLSIAEYDVFGLVVDQTPLLTVNAVWEAYGDNAGKVNYALDLVPIGSQDPFDLLEVAVDPAQDFLASLQFPAGTANQLALLTATPYHLDGTPGKAVVLPVYIYNQPGDVNGDGLVDMQDRQAFNGKVGLGSADSSYIPFFDSDYDGTITEFDVAAVGYFWTGPAL